LQLGILFGYLTIALGYTSLGFSHTVWMASACAMLAHMGGSTVWVFSTTLLQLHTDDRFRGRVFSGRSGIFNADHRRRRIPLWTLARFRGLRSRGRYLDGIGHADSCGIMGAGNASRE